MKKTLVAVLLLFSISIAYSQNAKKEFRDALNLQNFELAESLIRQVLSENSKDVDLHLLAGDVYLELGKSEQALATFRAAEKLSRRPFVMRKLALGLSANKYIAEAVNILRRLTNEEKNEVENWLLLADVYIAADSIRQAEIAVTRAREMDRNNVRAYIVLGDIYFAQRVYELSKNNYEEALKINPDLLDARMKLATSYYWLATRESDSDLRNELFNRSLLEWNTLTQKDPNNALAWFEQGKIFFFSSSFQQAAQSLNNYIQLRPSGSLGRWYLAQSLYELGRCDSARTHLRIVAKEIDTAAFNANLLLARCFHTESDFSDAANLFAGLAETGKLDMIDTRRWGSSAFSAGDTATAIKVWKKAVDMDTEGNCQLMYFLGSTLSRMKNYDEAISLLEKRINTKVCSDSTDFIIYYTIGTSYFFNGNAQSALEPLKKAVELNSNFLWSRIYLADVYANLGDLYNAELEFNNTILTGLLDKDRYKSELNQAYAKMAGIKLEQKKYRDLEKIGRDWLAAMPESEFAAIFTAVAYQGLNNIEAACRHYRMALRINPNNTTARDNVRGLGCD